MNTTAALIRKAKCVIEDPNNFARGTLHEVKPDGNYAYCALGAIGAAGGGHWAIKALADSVRESDYQPDPDMPMAYATDFGITDDATVASYSNCSEHECVLRWFDYTADRLEKENA